MTTNDGMDIRQASQSEIPAVAAVLARAFSTDPLTVAILGRPRDPRRLLTLLFDSVARRHYALRGAVDVAVHGGDIVGAALWARPGHALIDTRTDLAVMRDVAPSVRWRLLPLLRQDLRTRRVHPHEPHWYLYALGVAAPGHGVGGRMLDHGIHRAAEMPCYLEASTPDNARLYDRKGFRSIGTVPVPRGVPPLVQMWHEAASQPSACPGVDRRCLPRTQPTCRHPCELHR